MAYCYYNNGLSMRSVDSEYEAEDGEVLFGEIPTPTELTIAFPTYLAAAANQGNVLQATTELAKSDLTMSRISEAVSLGLNSWTGADVVAWIEYRRALRILIADGGGTLPVKPAYPSGT